MPAARTLTVVTNDHRTNPKMKLSKVDYDPSDPSKSKINVNFVRVTMTAGGAVPTPTSMATIGFSHGTNIFTVLEYKYVDEGTKKELIIWFYVCEPPAIKGRPNSIANLVVTINSTDDGADPNVETQAP